ncbi:MAG: hypothetical protein IJ758_03000 [Clostridia bacterium]|nr:hypothetical protein [Clostridia bacterium]
MLNRAFNIVEEQLNNELAKRNFTLKKTGDFSCVFSNDEVKYKLEYDKEEKKVVLSLSGGKADDDYKPISVWLFDPENDSEKEARSIANDFTESVSVNRKMKTVKKANKKAENSNSDLLFMANRFATIFPELKNDIKFERENYATFRGVTFAREKILPLLIDVMKTGKPEDKFKKVCSTLNNLYDNGNMDTRACVTMVILNSIEESDKGVIERVSEKLSEDLLNAWNAAKKYKNKKVKPERIKKKSFFEKIFQNSQYNS